MRLVSLRAEKLRCMGYLDLFLWQDGDIVWQLCYLEEFKTQIESMGSVNRLVRHAESGFSEVVHL